MIETYRHAYVDQTVSEPGVKHPGDARHVQIRCALSGIAESGCPALIIGEPGSGKRSLAMKLHAESMRARDEFVEISSSCTSAAEIQSVVSRAGSVYLVEIGNLSLPLQELLVHECFRGSEIGNPGLFFGSSRELVQDVRARRLREDFYHLISAITLRIPPLRFRKDEILDIADGLLTYYSKHFDRPRPELRDEMVEFLLGHNWPGNLKELQTAIKTLVAIGDQSISLAALKAAPLIIKAGGQGIPVSLKQAARAASYEIERQLISEVLCITGGNRKRAADELGISYKALLYKLKQFEGDKSQSTNQNGGSL